jgi:hypothetical protein
LQDIDWDAIQIEKRWEEEGPQQICCEDGMYEKLGLKEDDKKEKKARDEGDRSAPSVLPIDMSDELVCGDNLPNEMVGFCDFTKAENLSVFTRAENWSELACPFVPLGLVQFYQG